MCGCIRLPSWAGGNARDDTATSRREEREQRGCRHALRSAGYFPLRLGLRDSAAAARYRALESLVRGRG